MIDQILKGELLLLLNNSYLGYVKANLQTDQNLAISCIAEHIEAEMSLLTFRIRLSDDPNNENHNKFLDLAIKCIYPSKIISFYIVETNIKEFTTLHILLNTLEIIYSYCQNRFKQLYTEAETRIAIENDRIVRGNLA